MWVSKTKYECLEANITDLSRQVADLNREVRGYREYYDYCGRKVDSAFSLRKGVNLLMEHFDLEYKDGQMEPDRLIKVKK